MTNIERAADIIEELHRNDQLEGDGAVGCFDVDAAAQALADAGLLAPDPQIIRTVDELEALDQASLIYYPGLNAGYELAYDIYAADLPVVVVATGAQVRAARTALQEATE